MAGLLAVLVASWPPPSTPVASLTPQTANFLPRIFQACELNNAQVMLATTGQLRDTMWARRTCAAPREFLKKKEQTILRIGCPVEGAIARVVCVECCQTTFCPRQGRWRAHT